MDGVDFVAYHIQPLDRNDSNPMCTWKFYENEGEWMELIYSVDFHW